MDRVIMGLALAAAMAGCSSELDPVAVCEQYCATVVECRGDISMDDCLSSACQAGEGECVQPFLRVQSCWSNSCEHFDSGWSEDGLCGEETSSYIDECQSD